MQRHFLILPLAFAGAACSVSYEARVEAFNDRQQKQFDECIGPAPDALAEFSNILIGDGRCIAVTTRTRPADGKTCQMVIYRLNPWPESTEEACETQLRQAEKQQG